MITAGYVVEKTELKIKVLFKSMFSDDAMMIFIDFVGPVDF